MGFLFGSDDEERRERDDSLDRVERGGLPLSAERRLAGLRGPGVPFTSTLSVAGFALAAGSGAAPITQVMGSSVYHVGWQAMPWGAGLSGALGSCSELEVVSGAWNEARRLALGRMEQEARLAGAHAVVGVRLRHGSYDWAEGAVEMLFTGTAVAHPGAPAPEAPALTDLSAQDHWRLLRAGARPVGVVGATSVFYVVPSWGQRLRSGMSLSNQELPEFTRGVYAARETALARLTAQAAALGASGVVGVTIDQHQAVRQAGGDDSRRDLVVTFHALGTAIVDAAAPEPAGVRAVLDQGADRRGL